MTATATETPTEAGKAPGVGRIARVIGPVVDIEFPAEELPEIYNALKTTVRLSSEGSDETVTEMTLEVEQHLGDNIVRAIALKPTDGLVRRAAVRATGAPITVAVGDITNGKVLNVLGAPRNLAEGAA